MRKLMLSTIGFCIACALFAYLHIDCMWIPGVVCLVCAVTFPVIMQKYKIVKCVAVILFGVAIGTAWTHLYSECYLGSITQYDDAVQDFRITVTDYSYETTYGIAADGLITVDGKPYLVKFYVYDQSELIPSNTITGSFRVRLTTGNGFKEQTYHKSEGKFLLLYAKGDSMVERNLSTPWYCYPAVWRHALLEKITELFPSDVAGFAQALILGDRTNLDYEIQTALKVSGIQHVVAVSGLHVSILCMLFAVLTLRKRFMTLFVSTPLLLLFAAIVGFTPSVTRACIMQILILLAEVTNRDNDLPTSLSFSVLVMLVVNPMAITSVSLQLSAGCVVGIILFYSRIKRWILSQKWFGSAKGKGMVPKMKRWSSSSVSITISAMIVTTPFVAYYFGAVSLIGIITNLLTLWCISFVFYGIITCIALNFLSVGLAVILARIIAWPIRYVIFVAKLCMKIPFAAVYTESTYIVMWLMLCYILLAVFLLSKQKHPFLLGLCCLCLLGIAAFVSWLEPRMYACYATFLDVGQGQCIILQSEGHTFLVDCGGSSDTKTADIAAETLRSRGITRIDGIILTHYDRDHAGGVKNLLSRIRVDNIYCPDTEDNSGLRNSLYSIADERIVFINKDMEIPFTSGMLTIFAPVAYDMDNESCICVLFQEENCDILITGDRGELGEMMLLHQHTLPKLEVLVAGHHGSAGSTIEPLLEQTDPDVVVISVQKNNPYGHPSESLLKRLAKIGCTIYRTDIDGTIVYKG